MPSARPACSRVRSRAAVRLVSSATRRGRSAQQGLLAREVDARQQGAHAGVMLLGQHLGRRHQGALMAALDGGEQRGHGDDRLPGPDVALQQPVHRVGAGQVGADLGDGAVLGCGQGKREAVAEATEQLTVNLVADPDGVPFDRSLAHHQDHLQAKQLVEGQAPPGELAVGQGIRGVDLVQGPVASRAGFRRQRHGSGQRIREGAGPPQGLRHPVTDLPAAHARLLRLRVHRDDPAGAVPDQVDHRIRHPGPAPEALHLAEHHDLGAFAQLLGAARAG